MNTFGNTKSKINPRNILGGMEFFEEDLVFAQHPIAMSYYALCFAQVEGDYKKAISICLSAAQLEFCDPDIYLNLGRIFLLSGQKANAVKAFRIGLKYDSRNTELRNEMKKIGIRRKPVISFLHRRNLVNKFLGKLAYRRSISGLTANN